MRLLERNAYIYIHGIYLGLRWTAGADKHVPWAGQSFRVDKKVQPHVPVPWKNKNFILFFFFTFFSI